MRQVVYSVIEEMFNERHHVGDLYSLEEAQAMVHRLSFDTGHYSRPWEISTVHLTDKAMRRDLRKFGAGRESSFVYRRDKRAVLPLLIVPWLIYLSLPFALNPMAIFLTCAGMLGIATTINAATSRAIAAIPALVEAELEARCATLDQNLKLVVFLSGAFVRY